MTQNTFHPLSNEETFFLTFSDNTLLKKLLKAILPNVDVKDIVENGFQEKLAAYLDGKLPYLDVFAKDSDGKLYGLKIQEQVSDDVLGMSMNLYSRRFDREHAGAIMKNGKIEVAETYIIYICDFEPFKDSHDSRSKYSFHLGLDSAPEIALDTGLSLVVINPKANWQTEDIPADFKSFLAVFNEDYSNQPSEFAQELKNQVNSVNKSEAMAKILAKKAELELSENSEK